MSQFLQECQSYQQASVLLQNFNFKSPSLTGKIDSLPPTQCKFTIQSDQQDISLKENQENRQTPTFYRINSFQNSSDSFYLQQIDEDQYLNDFFTSSKSCQMINQSKINGNPEEFKTAKSLEIEPNMKSFENQSREDKVQRYRLKKPKRNFQKVIRYECRKKVAVDRARVSGRFQKQILSVTRVQNLQENLNANQIKGVDKKVHSQKANTQNILQNRRK